MGGPERQERSTDETQSLEPPLGAATPDLQPSRLGGRMPPFGDRLVSSLRAAGDESRADVIGALQRTSGNQGVTRMLLRATASPPPLPKFSPSQRVKWNRIQAHMTEAGVSWRDLGFESAEHYFRQFNDENDRALSRLRELLRKRLEVKKIISEEQGRAQADVKEEYADEDATVRSKQSELRRHADELTRTEGHHRFPKYLGGEYEQELMKLTKAQHDQYHEELDHKIGLPRWASKRYYDNLSQEERESMLRRLQEHADDFDERHKHEYPDKRTRIGAGLRREIADSKWLKRLKAEYAAQKAPATSAAAEPPDEGGEPPAAKRPPNASSHVEEAAPPKAKAPPASEGGEPMPVKPPPSASPHAEEAVPKVKAPLEVEGETAPMKPRKALLPLKVPIRVRLRQALPDIGANLGLALFHLLMSYIQAKMDEVRVHREINAFIAQLWPYVGRFAANAARDQPPGTPLFVNVTMILEVVHTPAASPDPFSPADGLDAYPHILLDSFHVSPTPIDDPGTKPKTKMMVMGFTSTTRFTFSIPIEYETTAARP